MQPSVWIGLDIGSVSVQLAALVDDVDPAQLEKLRLSQDFFALSLPENHNLPSLIVLSKYQRHQGNSSAVAEAMLAAFRALFPAPGRVWITGSGGRKCSGLGFPKVNEFRATACGVATLMPDIKTVFEIGGERSKYMLLDTIERGRILDYEANGDCAAGTGSFFDQQVARLRYAIEEVGEVVSGTTRSASIAGRCSVFAKSDMIHAQQRGYTPPEVLKGLCQAVVRNFKGTIAKGKKIETPIAFLGGVAANEGVVDALKKFFTLSDGQLIVPPAYAWMGAVGAALLARQDGKREGCDAERKGSGFSDDLHPSTVPLSLKHVRLEHHLEKPYSFPSGGPVRAYLGLDIGSVSTNLALVDEQGILIYGLYRMTDGRPIEVVTKALKDMADAVGDKVSVFGVGSTGSGRELIGNLVGADVIKDEITAHKTGALHIGKTMFGKEVDTIFEIGGQDSKFISLKDGVVVDFSLNEACAAGTGSFLEEQANLMGISIKDEFSCLAMRSRAPLMLGERCTVFMEKELIPYLQKGIPREDITAGLAYSVVLNYLHRVVKKRFIGDVIFFQGGTAYNESVAAAFSTILNKRVIVPPYNGIIGAIGAALLSRAQNPRRSCFRGWDLSSTAWSMREFTCQGCSNECRIQEFEVCGERNYWGDKCSERYRKRTRSLRKPEIPDLIRWWDGWLAREDGHSGGRGRVLMPRILQFNDRLPFWKSYFQTLGYEVVVSGQTTRRNAEAGMETAVAEPCFPIQASHGHLLELLGSEAEFIFLPNVVDEEDPTDSVASYLCPWAQTFPLVIRNTPCFQPLEGKLWDPTIHFRCGQKGIVRELAEQGRKWGIGEEENRRAVDTAFRTQARFRDEAVEKGDTALKILAGKKEPAVLLLGRPYALYDTGLNLNIPLKLRDHYGINVLPMDFIRLDQDIRSVHDHMYWNYGRRILQAARVARGWKRLHVICLSYFKCGPDSYIRHFIEEALGRPFLFLQLDSHANDAGMMTRIEAFLESHRLL